MSFNLLSTFVPKNIKNSPILSLGNTLIYCKIDIKMYVYTLEVKFLAGVASIKSKSPESIFEKVYIYFSSIVFKGCAKTGAVWYAAVHRAVL